MREPAPKVSENFRRYLFCLAQSFTDAPCATVLHVFSVQAVNALDLPSSVSLSNNYRGHDYLWPAAELFFGLALARTDGDHRLGLGTHLCFDLRRQLSMFAQESLCILTPLSQALLLI